ncbi:MAG: hypothetical protein LVQ75_04960 [Candidatus Babeliales bacterium]
MKVINRNGLLFVIVWLKKNALQFDAVQYQDKSYLKISENDQWHVKEALDHVLKNGTEIEAKTLQVTDLPLYFYNEQGDNRIKKFLDKSLFDPVKNIYWKIFKEPVKKKYSYLQHRQPCRRFKNYSCQSSTRSFRAKRL